MTNSYITHNRINRDNLVATSGAAACPMMNGRLTNRRASRTKSALSQICRQKSQARHRISV
jgi:hypothetical protein